MSDDTHCEPAYSLVRRMGGPEAVASAIRADSITVAGDRRAIMVNRSSVCRWYCTRDTGGTGGIIPLRYWPAIIRLGRTQGVTVTVADLSPAIANALQESAP